MDIKDLLFALKEEIGEAEYKLLQDPDPREAGRRFLAAEFILSDIVKELRAQNMTIPQCKGCSYERGTYCAAYLLPATKWLNGRTCPMATHIERKPKDKGGPFPLDPIKASKRKAGGKA